MKNLYFTSSLLLLFLTLFSWIINTFHFKSIPNRIRNIDLLEKHYLLAQIFLNHHGCFTAFDNRGTGPSVPSVQLKTNLPQVFIIFLAQFSDYMAEVSSILINAREVQTNDYRPNLFICKKSSRTGHASCARPWTRLCGASVDRASSMQIRYRVTNTRCNYRVLFHIPTTCYDFPFESLQSSSRCGGLLLKLIVTVNSTCVRLGNLYGVG